MLRRGPSGGGAEADQASKNDRGLWPSAACDDRRVECASGTRSAAENDGRRAVPVLPLPGAERASRRPAFSSAVAGAVGGKGNSDGPADGAPTDAQVGDERGVREADGVVDPGVHAGLWPGETCWRRTGRPLDPGESSSIVDRLLAYASLSSVGAEGYAALSSSAEKSRAAAWRA